MTLIEEYSGDQLNVLIAKGDGSSLAAVLAALKRDGILAEWVRSGCQLLERLEATAPDVLIIYIDLPDCDGRDACRAARAGGHDVPVIFVAGGRSSHDCLSAFAVGGDDYVAEWVDPDELVARTRALGRRRRADRQGSLGNVRLDPATHELSAGHESIALTPTEYRLLARLAMSPGDPVQRRLLVRAAWPPYAVVRDNTLDTYVSRLRSKLRAVPGAPEIGTVRGLGYTILRSLRSEGRDGPVTTSSRPVPRSSDAGASEVCIRRVVRRYSDDRSSDDDEITGSITRRSIQIS